MGAPLLAAAGVTLVLWAGAVLVATRGAAPWAGMDACAAAHWSYGHFGGAERFGPPRAFFAGGVRIFGPVREREMTVVFPDRTGGRVVSHLLVAHRHTGAIARTLRMGETPDILDERLTWRACGHLFAPPPGAAADGTRYGGA